jgi:hypothetical protein
MKLRLSNWVEYSGAGRETWIVGYRAFGRKNDPKKTLTVVISQMPPITNKNRPWKIITINIKQRVVIWFSLEKRIYKSLKIVKYKDGHVSLHGPICITIKAQ